MTLELIVISFLGKKGANSCFLISGGTFRPASSDPTGGLISIGWVVCNKSLQSEYCVVLKKDLDWQKSGLRRKFLRRLALITMT